MNPVREGDTVRIDFCYFVRERYSGTGLVGVVKKITSPYASRPTTYLVEVDGGREFTASRVTKLSEAATAPATTELDAAKVSALQTARAIAGPDASVGDVFRVADYIQRPVTAPVASPAPVPLRDLADDRRRFYEGLYADGVSIERDRANDDDLVYVVGGHLTISGAKEVIAYLQAAVNVGETEGTGPEPRTVAPF